MRVLLLSRYCRLGASSRLRCFQYLPMLAGSGVQVDINALYDEDYLIDLYQSNRRRWKKIISYFFQRIQPLLTSRRYDLLWIEQELFPWMPPFVEWLLHQQKIPYVVDYDDAIFHRYDLHRHRLIRWMIGTKIDWIMKHAAMVIAGNHYIAERAHKAGAKAVEIIPTVIDLNRYPITIRKEYMPLTIGWIGSPATYPFFESVAPTLMELQRRIPIRVAVVGVMDPNPEGERHFSYYPWSEDTEVELLKSFDVGIMPLPDTPWTKGKCGYKLIQYMACGIPVVASKVGANLDIVENGKNGFLVSTPQEWIDALERMVLDRNLRKIMGENGRRQVEDFYNIDKTFPILSQCLVHSTN